MAAGNYGGAMRASDHDRSRVQSVLNDAYAEGRLTHEEWDQRATTLASAATYADLDRLTADLPARHPGMQVSPAPQAWLPQSQTAAHQRHGHRSTNLRDWPARRWFAGRNRSDHPGSSGAQAHPDYGRERRSARTCRHHPGLHRHWSGRPSRASSAAARGRGDAPQRSELGVTGGDGPVPGLRAFRCLVTPCRQGHSVRLPPPTPARQPR